MYGALVTFGNRSDQIEHDGPALLWRQVAADLDALIDAGSLSGRLPAESDLADAYGVARVTVRRAIADLVERGRLRVVHGRGTYVIQAPRPSA